MKKNIIKIVFVLVVFLVTALVSINVYAENSEERLEAALAEELNSMQIDPNNLTKEDILSIYDKISSVYSNEEISNIIDENKDALLKEGISEETIETGKDFIKNMDRDEIRNIIEEEVNIEKIQEDLNKGLSVNEIIEKRIDNAPAEKKLSLGLKLLFTNKNFKRALKVSGTISLLLFVYKIVLRWIIYDKANRHGWASIIPIYNEITMYKVCGLSPWLLLFCLLPVIGWIAISIINIIKRFCLATKFNRGIGFGFGLWLLPTIFESIICFDKNIKYEKSEE